MTLLAVPPGWSIHMKKNSGRTSVPRFRIAAPKPWLSWPTHSFAEPGASRMPFQSVMAPVEDGE